MVCLGVGVTVVALSMVAYVHFEKGFADSPAEIETGMAGTWLGTAMDASTKRYAPTLEQLQARSARSIAHGANRFQSESYRACHSWAQGELHSRAGMQPTAFGTGDDIWR
jgi:hypothetical protein